MINFLQKKYANVVLKPLLIRYLKKERTTRIHHFSLLIKQTVFHPKFYFSTSYLFNFVSTLELNNTSFLEIGCGSGLISLLAHQKKAIVTCCDINVAAIECTELNFKKNFPHSATNYSILNSDLFDTIPIQTFDVIVINPPYFFDVQQTQHQLAWNCGKNGEYFTKLFSQLKNYIHAQSTIYMILADNCDIERIKAIATIYQFKFDLIEQKKIKWELNFIFKISYN